jgi:hypothetical protein
METCDEGRNEAQYYPHLTHHYKVTLLSVKKGRKSLERTTKVLNK